MSPTNPNLSYNQQQQIHRTGGLQRLTADLAGLQFNDAEALFKNYQQQQRPQQQPGVPTGGHRAAAAAVTAAALASGRHVASGSSGGAQRIRAALAAKGETTVTARATPHSQASLQQPPQPEGGYEAQMVVSAAGGSQGSECDSQREAQEMADDAAMVAKRYKIVQLVGTGNYARVYKCLSHQHHGKELAIKSINLRRTSENYKQKFLPRELSILKKLSHPNICKTHEIIHISDRVFIVMQYCSNGTIADLLHKLGAFTEPLARYLFAPVIDAVGYMHNSEFAHRDLKVENILLDADYNPKLTDFSYSISVEPAVVIRQHNLPTVKSMFRSALASSRLGQHGASSKHQLQQQHRANSAPIRLNETFCGTLPYLSPEMIKQYPYDAKKTDVWSLGICLYVMLNDRLPFPFNDIRLMIKKQMAKDYKFKNNLEFSEQIRDLMGQILEPDYARRPQCHEIGKHAWFNGPRERPS